MNTSALRDHLEKELSPKRFRHSLGVAQTAVSLAKRFGLDAEHAEIAGLLHDCAREMKADVMEALLRARGWDDALCAGKRELMHACAGSVVASEDYGVKAPEVLEAIRQHTFGGSTMSPLSRVICLADYIEPGRDFPGVGKLRKLAEKDLNEALLAALNGTLCYLLEENKWIHPQTLAARNMILSDVLEGRSGR